MVEVWEVDLADYESAKAFVRKVEGLDRVDVVLENAGILTERFGVAEDSE